MNGLTPRTRAAGVAALLFFAGTTLGIAIDRAWLSPAPLDAASITAAAMSERLGLSSEEEIRLVELLDSLHAEVLAAAAAGPEALRSATDAAHRRIEAALPPPTRPAFHAWMQEHHNRMTQPGR